MSRREELISRHLAELTTAWIRDRHTWPDNFCMDLQSFAEALADRQIWEESLEGLRQQRNLEMEED